jgi:hypothetical protein
MNTTGRNQFQEARSSREGGAASRAGALIVSLALVAALAWAGSASAQLPLQPVGSQFDITGFIQKATLDAPGDVLAGGTVQVNGHTIVVPRNTIFQMPAFAMTWQQLFTLAPAPYGPTQTGLALSDVPAPLTTYEIHVQGNRIGNTYIAGLIFIAQHSLMSGQGFINYLDFANNEIRVGGLLNDPTTGTRLRINDPIGRFAPAYTLDTRFTIDTDNPTIRTETGYPMCFPHQNPATGDDPLCPQRNRPTNPTTGFPSTIFTMQPAAGNTCVGGGPAAGTNPCVAAPFQVGDYITYSGNLMKDGAQPSAGPLPANGMAGLYVAAHTIIANVGIFTAAGTNPAYVATDVMLLGVGGLPIAGLAQEATVRTRFEGFTTDASSGAARWITLWGIDVDSCSTATSDRNWGSIDIDQGPPTGAVAGRWRFRPPSKVLSLPAGGTFLPATRMMRSVLTGAYTAAAPIISNNGLITGQYAAPIFEFLFPENLSAGNPPVPMNFADFPFLVNGTFAALPGVNVGQLVPFPNASVVAPKCGPPPNPVPPIAVATASPLAAVVGQVVTLDGSGSSDPNGLAIAWLWTPPAGFPVGSPNGLNSLTAAQASFTASVPGTFTFTLLVTNTEGLSASTSVTVTVSPANPSLAPVANAGVTQTVGAGTTVQLNGLASSDPNVPAQTLTFLWAQTNGTPVTLSSTTSATPTFKAPTPFPAGTSLTFQLTVTNTSGLSNSTSVLINVNPVGAPIANAGTSLAVQPNTLVTLNGSLSSDPAGLPLTYQWTQVGGNLVALTGATTVKPTFTAPSAIPQTLTFQLVVSNGFVASAGSVVTINVIGVDTITFTNVVYRIGKQRLDVTATSSVTDGTPVLTLANLGPGGSGLQMAFIGGGSYSITVQGIPQPASVTVNSSLGGTKSSPILTLRQ